jgi:predicted Zn-dependent peptidase
MEERALTKRAGTLLGRTAALFAGMALAAGSPPAAGIPGRSFVLDNGLRVFLYEKRDVPLVHAVTAFDVGSKNETDGTNGLVHLLEHCILFRGESAGRGAARGADIRSRGAYFNASTAQDLSVFEISLPAEHAGFALRNQRDVLFGFELGQEELDAEKEVVLEEFGQMEDDPQRSAADAMFQALFPGHPYGRLVYGRRDVVRAATVHGLLAFHRKYFVADNCALAVVGDFETAAMERLVREVFGPLPRTGFIPETIPPAAPLKKSVSLRLERDVQDGYLLIGFAAPDYNHADQYAMNVLTEVLGRGVNPLLPNAFKREGASVRTVSMAYLALRFGGAAVVSIKMDPKDLAAVEREAVDFLKRTRNESYGPKDFPPETEPFAFDYLESAKNQIRFAVGQSEESGLRLAGSLARHMILNTRADPGRFLDRIGKVDSDDLRRTAARYLGHGGYAAVSVAPGKAAKK